jgi:hypothetical protein
MRVSSHPETLRPTGTFAETVPFLIYAGAAAAGAPSLWPAPEYDGFALRTWRSTAEVSELRSAPWMRSTSVPEARMMKVGILYAVSCGEGRKGRWERYARTPYFAATACAASTSHFTKATFPGEACFVASASKTGAMILQGPHQVAWTWEC